MKCYDNWKRIRDDKIRDRNRENGSTTLAIPDDLKAFAGELVKLLANCGHGLGRSSG